MHPRGFFLPNPIQFKSHYDTQRSSNTISHLSLQLLPTPPIIPTLRKKPCTRPRLIPHTPLSIPLYTLQKHCQAHHEYKTQHHRHPLPHFPLYSLEMTFHPDTHPPSSFPRFNMNEHIIRMGRAWRVDKPDVRSLIREIESDSSAVRDIVSRFFRCELAREENLGNLVGLGNVGGGRRVDGGPPAVRVFGSTKVVCDFKRGTGCGYSVGTLLVSIVLACRLTEMTLVKRDPRSSSE